MLNEVYEVKIIKQDHFGNGIAKIDNKLVFVDKALPGDICKIKITKVKKNYVNGKILEILQSSNLRVDVKCPYYEICGGCHVMHEKYEQQLLFKENKVKELINKFTGLSNINYYPIIGNNSFYYRNKVIFHGKNHKLGFYQEKTNDLVDIKECIITNKTLNNIYLKIQSFLNDHPNTDIKKVMLRITSLNETLITLDGNFDKSEILSYLDMVSTVYLNNELVKGNSFITEDILGIKFMIYPSSFFQVNYDMMLSLYGIVIDFYKNNNCSRVLDLYCGTGTIGMLVSKYVDSVVGVEVESSSIKSANICKKLNGISNIEFIEGKVEDKIDLFKDINSIIVDPPRSGLDVHTIDIIKKLNPKSIVYVSCDPATLARDLNILKEKYNILEVHPVDMFPNTYHVETVCILKRKIEIV